MINKMKKESILWSLFAILIAVTFCVSLSACGDDDPDDGDNWYWYNNGGDYGGEDSSNGSGSGSGSGNNGGGDNGSGSGSGSSSGSGSGSGSSVPSAPTGLTASQQGPKAYPYVYLSWDINWGADHYVVYRSTSMYGSYSKKGTTRGSSYSDENISNGVTYYYKVTAANSSNKESGYSNVASVTVNTTMEPGIKTCSVSKGSNKITISWTYQPNGSYYSAPDEVRLITSTWKTIFPWTSASSKKSHTVKGSDLIMSNGDLAYENTLYLEVKNSAGTNSRCSIVWNWYTNSGYVSGECGYTTF